MICIVDCGSNKVSKLVQMVGECGFRTRTISMNEAKADAFKDDDGIIISGAPILLTEEKTASYLKRFDFLKTIDTPVLGICFGHQIIGLLYGAEITRCPDDRDWQNITFVNDSFLRKGLSDVCGMKEDHCEQISLPEEFELVAKSKIAEVEAMSHKTRSLYGVQFHPEVSARAGKALLKNFGDSCDAGPGSGMF